MHLNPKKILQKAARGRYAIGAFNACNLETVKAIFAAALKLQSPVIIEMSPGEADYLGAANLVCLVNNFVRKTKIPVLVNLDHATDEGKIKTAMKAGFNLLHFDGSRLEQKIYLKKVKQIVALAHKNNQLVEGEMDPIAGSSAPHAKMSVEEMNAKLQLTNPEQAQIFTRETGVDIFAVAIGNIHGTYAGEERLNIPLLKKIRAKTACFFSLHGGSGIADDDVKQAIKHGIVKVNVNTELRVAFRTAIEKVLKTTDEAAVYKYMPEVIAAVQAVVEEKIKVFGSAGKI
jgi:ketose-bisphosphate aldolase